MRTKRKKALIVAIIVNTHQVKVCTLGFTDITLPVLEIGQGKPIVSIVAGMHGNETSGLLVIDTLLDSLPSKINGTVQIILSANPLALNEQKRMSSIDCLDMNRIFPGDANKTVTQKIAKKISEIVRHADMVLDLHAFDMKTPLMGILITADDAEQTERNVRLMQQFIPRQVWVIDIKKGAEREFNRCLGSFLNNHKIPNIAVEMDSQEVISRDQIKECVQGIIRVLSEHRMIEMSHHMHEKFEFLDRSVIASSESGIFVPTVEIFDIVKEGDKVGVLKIVQERVSIPIMATISGRVMQILRSKFVLPGQELIAIGQSREMRT